MRKLSWIGTFALAAAAAGAASAEVKAPAVGVETLVGAERDLTFELARKILPDRNAVFSPASIHFALGMTYAGAKGATADEMARVLHFDRAGGQSVHPLFGQLANSLAKLEHKDQAFRMANRLFGAKKYPWNRAFLDATAKGYGAGLEAVDFGEPETTRKYINGWVEKQTNNKIVDLLPKNSLTKATAMVLTNAVYFKGKWSQQFEKHATQNESFLVAKAPVKVPMMNQTASFLLGGDAGAQIVELPYAHRDLAMDIILPVEKDGLAALEQKLDGASFVKLLGTMKPTFTEVKLPKFKVRSAVTMKKLFEELGMRAPFSDAANFSGMAGGGGPPLRIDEIYHQGFVDVDENGTEAAAATAVVMAPTGVAIKQTPTPFHANRPFLWLIRDLATGEILFYGRVVDPR